MILEADEIVGRIMSELENQGIADDTLIGMIQKIFLMISYYLIKMIKNSKK